MSIQNSKIILSTWGYPTVSYGGGEPAKILYAPDEFDEFREIMDFKKGSERFGGSSRWQVHYQDEDEDWVPIESQLEYNEALKYLKRAKVPVPLRLCFPIEERRPKCLKPSPSGACKLRAKEVERQLRKLQKEGGKSNEKCSRGAEKCSRHASTSSSKEVAHGKSAEKPKLKGSGSPPVWFEKYMQKFKSDLLSEVAEMLEQKGMGPITRSVQPETAEVATGAETETADVSTSTGKVDLTSVLAPLAYMDQKSSKLKKKMSKANNSEKKLKKLNSKLEQLELKRSRLLEWNRKRQEQHNPHAQFNILSPSSPSASVVMDVSVLSGGNNSTDKMYVTHDTPFVKTWHVMNTGNTAWTDKTELRLAHVTPGLKPVESIVACPLLQPGQEGDISVQFQSPDFAGLFECYWHFYHDDVRFGQWMGCAVVVDPKPSESSDEASSNLKSDILHKAMKDIQLQMQAPPEVSPSVEVAAAADTEDRAEYDSDPDDNNNVSHSDNQSSSDSEDSDDSESFVHVPLPQCYQFHDMPLFNIPPGQDENATDVKEGNLSNMSTKPNTPPTTPRDVDSEEEELFVEASEAGSHVEPPSPEPSTSQAGQALTSSIQQDPMDSPPVRILPETFVTGAIHVATRALSGAEAIMKSFQGSGFNIPPQPEASASTSAPGSQPGSLPTTPTAYQPGSTAIPLPPPPARKLTSNVTVHSSPYMQTLQEMGFTNQNLNATLLIQHHFNLSQVVAELLSITRENP